ncbi:MAG: branched-chain amino acid transporter permease [Succinivibrio sp.]
MTEMSFAEQMITIALCAVATMLTRFISFVVFSPRKPTPRYIQYLGVTLPCGIFAMLVVYCLRDVDLFSYPHGIPEAIALAFTLALHLWKRQMLLSMAGGTALYMILMQTAFA